MPFWVRPLGLQVRYSIHQVKSSRVCHIESSSGTDPPGAEQTLGTLGLLGQNTWQSRDLLAFWVRPLAHPRANGLLGQTAWPSGSNYLAFFVKPLGLLGQTTWPSKSGLQSVKSSRAKTSSRAPGSSKTEPGQKPSSLAQGPN